MKTKLRILVDTNFFINVDADQGRAGRPVHESLDEAAIQLSRMANKHGAVLCLSSATKEDLLKGYEPEAMLKKMAKYEIVGEGLTPSEDFWRPLGPPSTPGTNNYIDDCILNVLFKDAVHFLITSDAGVHRKAARLNLEDRVLTPQEGLNFLIDTYEPGYKVMHEVREASLCNIPLEQSIFDSLKKDYGEKDFEKWYAKKSREGITAWCIGPVDSLHAIAIYDPENAGFHGEMKICTFKVAADQRGEKLGELLVKQILNTAFKLNKKEIFVETGPEKEDVKTWFSSFGFQEVEVVRKPNGSEQLVMKRLVRPSAQDAVSMMPVELMKRFYPYCLLPPDVSSYIVPIKPWYAEQLFSDSLPQARLPMGGATSDRAIRKVYVSNSGIRKMEPGDVLFFYVSSADRIVPTQVIVTMGVVDGTLVTEEGEELLAFAGKRSVYSEDQLLEFLEDEKIAFAVKFWHIDRIGEPINLADLPNVFAPQTFATLTLESYNAIAHHAKLK